MIIRTENEFTWAPILEGGLSLRRHLHDDHPGARDSKSGEEGALAWLIRSVENPGPLLLGVRFAVELPGPTPPRT